MKRLYAIAFALLVVSCTPGSGGSPSPDPPPPPPSATVPALVGAQLSEARGRLVSAGLELEVQREYSAKHVGTVLRQQPAAGQEVDPGALVGVFVAIHPVVPRVLGTKFSAARRQARSRELRLVVVKRVPSHKSIGTVIEQRTKAGQHIRAHAPIKVVVASEWLCGEPLNPWCFDFAGGSVIYNPSYLRFCNYFNCISSFWESTNGYVIQCADGEFSHSGGVSGSCSSHGGNGRVLYQP